jgi:hypothetical protein
LRWIEEVDLLEEEMLRIIRFLVWRSDWWKGKVDQRGLPDGPQREGETAYVLRQAAIQATLAEEFRAEWKTLPELIRRGRDGDMGEDSEDHDEEEGADIEEENAPIPMLPQRAVKSTYVDEVLAM